MREVNLGYKLSTGKTIEPHGGIIGLSEIDGFNIYEGYDSTYITSKHTDDVDDIDLTNEELKEIALYMSDLWLKYASSL